jgi:hypothetical protein
MTTLLQKMTEERALRQERLRLAVRDDLRSALRDILPGMPVTVFGSLTRPNRFTGRCRIACARLRRAAVATNQSRQLPDRQCERKRESIQADCLLNEFAGGPLSGAPEKIGPRRGRLSVPPQSCTRRCRRWLQFNFSRVARCSECVSRVHVEAAPDGVGGRWIESSLKV